MNENNEQKSQGRRPRQGQPEDWLSQMRKQLDLAGRGALTDQSESIVPEPPRKASLGTPPPPIKTSAHSEEGVPTEPPEPASLADSVAAGSKWWLPSSAAEPAPETPTASPPLTQPAATPIPALDQQGDTRSPSSSKPGSEAGAIEVEAIREESIGTTPPETVPPELAGPDFLGALIQEIDQELGDGGMTHTPASGPRESGQKFLLFDLGRTRCAAAVGTVIEIGYPPPITRVPNVPDWVEGISNLRGDLIAIVDFRHFLGLEEREEDKAPARPNAKHRLLVARSAGEEVAAGLLVDGVQGVTDLEPADLASPEPTGESKITPYLLGVEERDGDLTAVLDLEKLLLSPAFRALEAV